MRLARFNAALEQLESDPHVNPERSPRSARGYQARHNAPTIHGVTSESTEG